MEFLIGMFVGGLLFWLFSERKRPSGTLIIDLSDPNKDIFRFEFYENLNEVYSKKKIILKVKTVNDSLE